MVNALKIAASNLQLIIQKDFMQFNVLLGMAFICLIWGSTWLVIKWGYDSFPPLLGSSIRFIVASLILFPFLFWKKERLSFSKDEWKVLSWMGIFSFGIAYGCVYIGETYIPSALASILFTTYPFWTAIYSYYLLKETQFTPVKIVGIILGFTGIILIFAHQIQWEGSLYTFGMTLIIISAAIQSYNLIMIKKYGTKLSPWILNAIPMGIGGMSQLLVSFLTEDWTMVNLTTTGIISTLYLSIFGSVLVFAVYWWLLSKVQAMTLSLTAFITPIVAVIFGYLFGGEILTFWTYLGGLVAISGLMLYHLKIQVKKV